jgi:peptidyl-tRNA hydrolase
MKFIGTEASYRASAGIDTPSGRRKRPYNIFIQRKNESNSAFDKRVEKAKKATKEHIEKDKKRKEKRAMRQAGLKE